MERDLQKNSLLETSFASTIPETLPHPQSTLLGANSCKWQNVFKYRNTIHYHTSTSKWIIIFCKWNYFCGLDGVLDLENILRKRIVIMVVQQNQPHVLEDNWTNGKQIEEIQGLAPPCV